MGELIAVLSGKGGTGKTSVCAAVSTTLARMGHKVLAIDCDMGLQNLDISLGLSDSGAISFLDVCEGGYRLDQAAKHHSFETLSFLTAPLNRTAEGVDPEAFRAMLRGAKQEFDYIFLDAPSISKPQQTVDLETGEITTLEIQGRHDPCIVPRAVPVVEAAAAIAIFDAWLEFKARR